MTTSQAVSEELPRCGPTRSLNLSCSTLRLHPFELRKFDPPGGICEVEILRFDCRARIPTNMIPLEPPPHPWFSLGLTTWTLLKGLSC